MPTAPVHPASSHVSSGTTAVAVDRNGLTSAGAMRSPPLTRVGSTAARRLPRLAVDQVVQHHQVDRAARADVLDVGAQRAGAERDPDARDDRVGEGDPNEGKPSYIG